MAYRNWIELNGDVLAGVFGVSPDDLLCRIPSCERRIDRETTSKERAEIAMLYSKGGLVLSKNQLRTEYAFNKPSDVDDEFRGEPVMVPSGAVAASPEEAGDGISNPKPEAARRTTTAAPPAQPEQ